MLKQQPLLNNFCTEEAIRSQKEKKKQDPSRWKKNINKKKRNMDRIHCWEWHCRWQKVCKGRKGCKDGFTYKCVCTSGSDTGSTGSSGN